MLLILSERSELKDLLEQRSTADSSLRSE